MADEKSAAQALDAPTKVSESPAITQPMEVPEPPAESLKTSSSASRRVRARLARRMTAQRSTLNPVLEPLVAVHREIYPKANVSMLQRGHQSSGVHSQFGQNRGDGQRVGDVGVAGIA
ncbi:hypothetical protein [Mycobacterium sp. 1465703.0]|uniref:hypothetical protein n=1 Tax=Mycobacterium sp. 1465703.0 TaxID=1834078 RepID=UPI000B29BD92